MKVRNDVKAGTFVLVSFVLIAGLILVMGRERQIFAKQSEFFTTFKDVKGLSVGAPIRLGGISIGRVAEVGFSKDLKDLRVHVTLLINDSYLDRIHPDSIVSIDTQGLLGDRFVSISPGSDANAMPTGSTLPSVEITDLSQVMARAQAAMDNTTQITEKINHALEGLSPDTIAQFATVSKSVSDLLAAIKTEEGFIHRLIYSEKDGEALTQSISKLSQDIAALVGEARNGKGLLHSLVYDPNGKQAMDALTRASTSIATASEGLAALIAKTRDGKGLLHDIVYADVASGSVSTQINTLLTSLNETAANLKTASEALSQGTGTLGALLVDPKLYDNLMEVTDGAKRSFLLRQAIRSSLK